MHKLFLYAIIFIFLFISVILIKPTAAISETIVISQVQLGDSSSASNEFIEIYNNSLNDIDITGWCLYYASANSILIGNKLVCFTTESDAVHLFLPVNSYLFSISNQFLINKPSLNSDFRFSATLSGTAGHIRLVDKSGIEIDKLGWGTSAVSAEGLSPAILPTTGKVLSRKVSDKEVNLLHDTDVNSQDFETILPRINYSYGSIYEVVDICSNLEGIQEIVPDGYILENYSTCVLLPVDMCLNIDGLQAIVPGGYVLDSNSECKIDE